VIYTSAKGHRTNAFSDLKLTVDRTCKAMRPKLGRFDALVVRGVSGLSVGAPVSVRLGVPLLVVRKPGETQHCSDEVLGLHEMGLNFRWVHLDDFSYSGATEHACQAVIAKNAPDSQQVGSFFYNHLIAADTYPAGPWRAPLVGWERDTKSLAWRAFCPELVETVPEFRDSATSLELAGVTEELPGAL
jgi:hypothetical protein